MSRWERMSSVNWLIAGMYGLGKFYQMKKNKLKRRDAINPAVLD